MRKLTDLSVIKVFPPYMQIGGSDVLIMIRKDSECIGRRRQVGADAKDMLRVDAEENYLVYVPRYG